jgi:L-fuconolactonase
VIEIIDGQYHIGRGAISETLSAMDALGIQGAILDEYWGTQRDASFLRTDPGYDLANGAFRTASPTAELACLLHSDRFSYLVRVDRNDPQISCLLEVLASSPHVKALRLQPVNTAEEAEAFRRGLYDAVFAQAQTLGLAVCLFIPGHAELLPRYAQKFPNLWFVVDHSGMGYAGLPPNRPQQEIIRTTSAEYLAEVVRLAELPNVALKWSHAQDFFGVERYPYASLLPRLRQVVSAFSAERVIWASDSSVMPHTWADLLYCIREAPDLDEEEKAAILGGSARRIFSWPARAVHGEVL